jgi:hypothetical protein
MLSRCLFIASERTMTQLIWSSSPGIIPIMATERVFVKPSIFFASKIAVSSPAKPIVDSVLFCLMAVFAMLFRLSIHPATSGLCYSFIMASKSLRSSIFDTI